MNDNDTIFALSSGHSKSGVAVIRISGDNLENFAHRLISPSPAKGGTAGSGGVVVPRRAYFTNLTDDTNEIIDQCVVIYFAAPHSFTGQDVIEIQCHGAPAVINKIFEFLGTHDMRIATPGEFSRRAFYNGKMDLSDADGLAALLDAQTDKQRAAALKSMMGGDGEIYANWRDQMLDISAYIFAMTDYAPDDLPPNIFDTVLQRIKTLYTAVSAALAKYNTARAIRSGINIAVVGETNVGKSSLFNRILGTARAIVSDIPGTTRDVVSANLDIDGFLVNLADTAGIRETTDSVERIGIERTNTEIANADIVLHVINANNSPSLAKEWRVAPDGVVEILVVNKSDITESRDIPNAIYVSARDGRGMDKLLRAITERIRDITGNGESVLMINARTYDLLKTTANELKNALEKTNGDFDIMSEHVRYAADAIGKILGTIGTDEVINQTFSQLCLGK
ncbi:MAG: tRNA uridine-5-carboxymethylaminomethyl(34) synthesis GTPase MnmE [Alphaproteobacteria bacterium]|nr:tRNA uridine-5-carboxymethylaminomethyl(34) synthesis GTPase MnmE [Alphaproteobacteria bacterium]